MTHDAYSPSRDSPHSGLHRWCVRLFYGPPHRIVQP
jgi:hypothetical protein